MNENYYIYYIIPDTNFISEKENSENSQDLPRDFLHISNLIKDNILLILLIILLIFMFKNL